MIIYFVLRQTNFMLWMGAGMNNTIHVQISIHLWLSKCHKTTRTNCQTPLHLDSVVKCPQVFQFHLLVVSVPIRPLCRLFWGIWSGANEIKPERPFDLKLKMRKARFQGERRSNARRFIKYAFVLSHLVTAIIS